MLTRRGLLRAGAVAACIPSILSRARAADRISVVLPLGFQIDFFDTMNAKSGGHFAKFGLDAEVIGANSGVQTIQLVTSGQANFGRGSPADLIRAVAAKQQAPIAVASIFQGCPFRVFSPKQKPVREPKDFKGKIVGLITLASPTGIYLDVMLAQAGLTPADVERQPTGGTPGALEIMKAGRVDCFISTTSVEKAAQLANAPVEVWNPDKYLPLPGQVFYGMPDRLAATPDVAVRFLQACKASIDEMLSQPLKPMVQRAAKDFDIPGVNDLDLTIAMLETSIKELLLADGRENILKNLPARWTGGVKALRDAHIVDIDDASALYTNRYVDAALKV